MLLFNIEKSSKLIVSSPAPSNMPFGIESTYHDSCIFQSVTEPFSRKRKSDRELPNRSRSYPVVTLHFFSHESLIDIQILALLCRNFVARTYFNGPSSHKSLVAQWWSIRTSIGRLYDLLLLRELGFLSVPVSMIHSPGLKHATYSFHINICS